MAEGPEVGLAAMDALAEGGRLDGYFLLPAGRAELLRRLGGLEEARASYERALDLAPFETERRWLAKRLRELSTT
jgi:RNA polymerase sigma-70 factor (ECF subfamily)